MTPLLTRDLRLAIRAGGGFGLALAFFLIVIVLVPFGVGPEREVLARIAPGVLWIGALLACLLSLDRIFAVDFEDGSLDLLATAPLPLETVIYAKALAHWLTTGLPLTLAAPVLAVLLNLPVQAFATLVLSLAIGTPALSMLGAFGAALTVGLKRGGLLLSLLVLPLYVPTLIFGADAVRRAGEGLATTTPVLLVTLITLGTLAVLPFAAASRNWGSLFVSFSAFVYFVLPHRQYLGNTHWFLGDFERWVLWLPFAIGIAMTAGQAWAANREGRNIDPA